MRTAALCKCSHGKTKNENGELDKTELICLNHTYFHFKELYSEFPFTVFAWWPETCLQLFGVQLMDFHITKSLVTAGILSISSMFC